MNKNVFCRSVLHFLTYEPRGKEFANDVWFPPVVNSAQHFHTLTISFAFLSDLYFFEFFFNEEAIFCSLRIIWSIFARIFFVLNFLMTICIIKTILIHKSRNQKPIVWCHCGFIFDFLLIFPLSIWFAFSCLPRLWSSARRS